MVVLDIQRIPDSTVHNWHNRPFAAAENNDRKVVGYSLVSVERVVGEDLH